MQKIIAIIGCGRIANFAHLPALSKMEDVRIKYACDLLIEKANAVVEKYGAEQAITDYKIALADPEVQTVFVLTPNYAHYVITMDALRAGKNVMCEKPITVNYALSKEMADEAEKQGKLLNNLVFYILHISFFNSSITVFALASSNCSSVLLSEKRSTQKAICPPSAGQSTRESAPNFPPAW